nr:uncharacterized protein LOC111509932 [Leptinotarsa decemlineata]
MHRSITLSMVSSTFSNNNKDTHTNEQNKEIFFAKIGIGFIEFLISSSFLCYGIIFAENVEGGVYSVGKGLWTLVLYSSIRHITSPPAKLLIEYVGERLSNGFRYIICTSSCLLCIGLVLPGHVLTYGIFCGVSSSLIFHQLKYFSTKQCRFGTKVYEGNIQSARAISLLISPHLMLLLVSNYSMDRALLIFAALLLNVIPAVFVLKTPGNHGKEPSPEMSRYSTLPAFSRQMSEMVEFSRSTNLLKVDNLDSSFIDTNDEESELSGNNEEDEGEKSVTSLKDVILNHKNEVVEEIEQPIVPLTHETVQMYYSIAGVTILPEIPEESEDTQKSKNDYIDPKRLSKISMILEEINQKENKVNEERTDILNIEDLLRKVENREKVQSIEYIQEYQNERKSFLREIETVRKRARCSCCSSYIWKQRFLKIKYCCLDYFLMPIFNSFTEPLFYPIVISKVMLTLNSTIFISLAPYFARKKIQYYKQEDTTLLLSYLAFAWSLFLMFLPLLRKINEEKLRRIFILGLALTGSSMILLTKQKLSNDFIVWSCLLYGCGYGMMTYTENMVYETFLNERRMKIIEGCLEIFSGLFVILVYYLIYYYRLDILSIFPMSTFLSNVVIAVIWLSVPQLQTIGLKLKRYFQKGEVEDDVL